MRGVLAVVMLGALARPAAAGEARGSSETLVGWSADGTRFAVIGFTTNGKAGPEFFLEVREGGRSLYRHVEESSDDGKLDKIDVASWAPLKKFKLERIEPAARKRFTDALVATSTTRMTDRYHCGAGGWSVKKKGATAALREEKAAKDHCISVMGGYVNKAGTHALVKLREAWQHPTRPEKVTEENDRFVLLAL